jgi:hypothetical protein
MFGLLACGGGSGAGKSVGLREVLMSDEIAKANVSTAYEAVSRLRPYFLQTRGTAYPIVYVDNVRYGDVTSLREIAVQNIDRIEYISASDATTRFGTGHAGGVIMVIMRVR